MLTSAEGQNTLFVFINDHTGVQIKLRGISWHSREGNTSMIEPLSHCGHTSPAMLWHCMGFLLLPCPGTVRDPGAEKPLRQNQQLVK